MPGWMARGVRSLSVLLPDSSMMRQWLKRGSSREQCVRGNGGVHAYDLSGWWPTKRTARASSNVFCGDGVSSPSSHVNATRNGDALIMQHCIGSVTSWNAFSVG